MASVQVTYYVDTLSSWCLIAESAVDRLLEEFGTEIDFEWKIAQLNDAAPFDGTPEKFEWMYRRTHAVTGVQLNHTWHTKMEDSSLFPNLAAEAARTLGVTDGRVRRALSRAAMLEGKRVPDHDVAVEIASKAGGLDPQALSDAMDDHNTFAKVVSATIELRKLPVRVIPCFAVANDVGDRAILSGLYEYATIGGVVREMVHASARYDEFMANNPEP